MSWSPGGSSSWGAAPPHRSRWRAPRHRRREDEVIRIEGEVVIERPVEEVFDFVADARNEPRYNPRMLRAEKLTPGPIGLGTRFRDEVRSVGRPAEVTIEVVGYE